MKNLRRMRMMVWLLLGMLLAAGVTSGTVLAQNPAETQAPGQEKAALEKPRPVGIERGLIALGAGLAIGLGCAAAGYAVGHVGAAAVGALAEKPELTGRVIVFVGLAEGISIMGLIVAVLLWLKM